MVCIAKLLLNCNIVNPFVRVAFVEDALSDEIGNANNNEYPSKVGGVIEI